MTSRDLSRLMWSEALSLLEQADRLHRQFFTHAVVANSRATVRVLTDGYGVPPEVDWPLGDVIAAFQRHFRPASITGCADTECQQILQALLPI